MTPLSDKKILIMIPTYNEVDNVDLIVSRIRALEFEADILFVDDNSPDGTGKHLENMTHEDPHLHVLHRPGKLGVGSAHLDGIAWAYEHGYDTLVTMDSDQTHSPEDISVFLEKSENSDVVIGTRFAGIRSLLGWSLYRKFMTHLGHMLTRILLGMPYDATGGFRVYRLQNIPQGIFKMVETGSYSFFFESLLRLHINGIRIEEVPILLPARTYGHSKMRFADVMQGLTFLLALSLRTHTAREGLTYVKPFVSEAEADEDETREEWDIYWKGQEHSGKWLYDLIAAFYRRFIIRPAVNHFLSKHFAEKAHVLHAGCGSGAVDTDMAKKLKITALDLSPAGLTEYARFHPGHEDFILGSIFEIPAEPGTYNGIFNLGVMEHFHEDEIKRILVEFHRVLKPGGCIIMFWPPKWGLTVNVLKAAHFVLNTILGKNIKLHPDEHTHVTSRKRTAEWLQIADLDMLSFYFGPRDFFTHQVIVAEKRKS